MTTPLDLHGGVGHAANAARDGASQELLAPVRAGLKRVFRQRRGHMALRSGSVTDAWQAAIATTLRPGDRVLMARHGAFSMRWAHMAARHGLEIDVVDAPWGEGTPVPEFARRLEADHARTIKAVFVTQNESSTGVLSSVAAVRDVLDATDHGALLFVDGATSIGAADFRMDEWGVDLAITGVDQALMLAPGLTCMALSEKLLAATPAAQLAGSADDVPASLCHRLKTSLDRLFDEGLENVFARHRRLAEGIRRGVRAIGLSTCAADARWVSPTVTAVRMPLGVDADDVIRIAGGAAQTAFGRGLGPLAGRALRIGHVGAIDELTCLDRLAVAESALRDAGAPIIRGAAVGAACAWYDACGMTGFRAVA